MQPAVALHEDVTHLYPASQPSQALDAEWTQLAFDEQTGLAPEASRK